jgi:hypothetical protein
MHYFLNLFWYRTLHVSDRFAVHHQESSTACTATGICHTGYADCLPLRSGWILILLAEQQVCVIQVMVTVCQRDQDES